MKYFLIAGEASGDSHAASLINALRHCDAGAEFRFFGGDLNAVPKTALTVGVGTVMAAKSVMLIVNGHNKARALQHGVEGAVSQMWTISALQLHRKAIIGHHQDGKNGDKTPQGRTI